jgi:hypothetical protein
MQAARSDRKIKPNNFDMKLLNFRHSMGSENAVHSAQEAYPFSMPQVRSLHQVAFWFSRHPGHLSDRYRLQAPQYNPQ